jgi:hypothetical protein
LVVWLLSLLNLITPSGDPPNTSRSTLPATTKARDLLQNVQVAVAGLFSVPREP